MSRAAERTATSGTEKHRLRALAEGALGAYGLEGRVTLLNHTINTTFRVDARPRSSSAGVERFVMRLYRPGTYSAAMIRSEVAWLRHLHGGEGVEAPVPLAAADGEALTELGEEAGAPRYCVLFCWLEGRFADGAVTPGQAARIGELLGRLHRAGDRFAVPADFERPRFDLDGLLGEGPVIPAGLAETFVARGERQLLDEAAAHLRRDLGPLGEGPEVFGLVHGDLTPKNCLFYDGRTRVLDFADFGWGYYPYDVATSLLRLSEPENAPGLRDAFLEGYRRIRPLPAAHTSAIEAFEICRRIYLLRWLCRFLDLPEIRQRARDGFPFLTAQVRRYLDHRRAARGAAAPSRSLAEMSTVELLAHLHRADVELRAEGDRLRFSAPKGALTPTLKEEMARRKDDLLRFLRQTVAAAGAGGPPLVPVPRRERMPLSFAQERLWFFDRYEPRSTAYNMSTLFRLRGPLEPAALARGLNEIVRRHEILRTTFLADEPAQVIAPGLVLAPPLIDFAGLAPGHREATARRLARRLASRPFDLRRGPLLRAALLRLADDEHFFAFTIHHIVSDGWSSGILVSELMRLYGALATTGEKTAAALPELPIQYADFAHWQRRRQGEELFERQLTYWRTRLEGAPHLLSLPTDRPRPTVPAYAGGKSVRLLPPSRVRALEALCQREGCTPFMALLAAFDLLLGRYTGERDLVVGTPIGNRNRAEVEGLIGFFANTLVLRTRIGSDATFRELLEEVRRVTLGAYENQDLPFEKVVEALRPERSIGHHPLVQVMFVLQNQPSPPPTRSGLEMSVEPAEDVQLVFDLIANLEQGPSGLRVSLRYSRALFDGTTAARMATHFERLVAGCVADPDERLTRLGMLTAAQHHQLTRGWNDTEAAEADGSLIHELFERQAEHRPDALALAFARRRLSYAELNARANRLAHHLRSLGVGPGTMAGISMERCPEMVVALLGILKAGGAYVPLERRHPEKRLAVMMRDAGVEVLLAAGGAGAGRAGAGVRRVELDRDWPAIARRSSANPVPLGSASPLAYVIYTSGSTGAPKGVTLRHAPVLNLIRWVHRSFAMGPRDRVLFLTSLSFDLSVYDVFGILAAGGSIRIASREDLDEPQRLVRLLRDDGVTFWDSAPAALQQLVPLLPGESVAGAALRLVFLSGDWIPVQLPDQVRESFPAARVVSLGGATEATVWSNVFPIRRVDPSWTSIPYGRPIRNAGYFVLDRRLSPCPIGVPGDLFIGGRCLSVGYARAAVLTAAKFIPDPWGERPGARLYRTGDRARFLADGNLEFLGRLDQQVKIRGFRIELGEIEVVLSRHEAVREGVVLVREETPGERRLVAYVVPRAGSAPDPRGLRGHLSAALPEYMVPATFLFLDAIPLTANGKVDRTALGREALPARDGAGGDEAAVPGDPQRELLAGIWAEILGLERVGFDDNFFEIGGHSLLATQIVSRVRELFQVELPLPRLFEAPTVAELAETLRALREKERGWEAPPIRPVPRNSVGADLPLSFAQQRLWFLELLQPGSAAYNIFAAVELGGALEAAVLERSFNEMVRRHESLRTTFVAEDGQPRQVITARLGLTLPVVDLRRLPAAARGAETRRLVLAEEERPFDLSVGPLIRVTLLETGAQEQVLLITMHHIISDGWSMTVFQRELVALYEAFTRGRPSPLAEPDVQYADFAHWQRQWLRGEVLEAQLAYWRGKLAGVSEMRLPTDRRAAPDSLHRGRKLRFELPAPRLEALRALGRKHGGTLFITLLAVFQTLLWRYAGQDHVVVGTVVANRNRKETEGILGFFINTLLLCVRLSESPSFREALGRVREAALGAFDHQDLPFEQLVKALRPERDLSFQPLYQEVVFAFQQRTPGTGRSASLAVTPLRFRDEDPETEIRGNLIFNLFEAEEEGVGGELWYNHDLFDVTTMTRFLRHLGTLSQSVAGDAGQQIGEVELLAAAERHQLLAEWSGGWAADDGSSPLDVLWEEGGRPPAGASLRNGVRVLDAGGRPVPLGVYGELRIGEATSGIEARYLGDGSLERAGDVPRRIPRFGGVAAAAAPRQPAAVPAPPSREDFVLQRRRELRQRRGGLSTAKRELLRRQLAGKLPAAGEQLALLLRRASPGRPSPVVELQGTGSGPPFFWVHPVEGTVFCYEELARCLGSEQPFYAFQAPGIDDEEKMPGALEEIAREYTDALVAARPHGPYLLAGWSFGGVVAFEMARQLWGRGAEIALLVLLESPVPAAETEQVETEARLLYHFIRNLEGLGGRSPRISYDEIRTFGPEDRLPRLITLAHERKILPADVKPAQIRRLLKVYVSHLEAMSGYRPRAWPGRIYLVHSAELPAETLRPMIDGWNDLAGEGLEVHETPGDHYTMLAKPHVGKLAKWLQDQVDTSTGVRRQTAGPGRELSPRADEDGKP